MGMRLLGLGGGGGGVVRDGVDASNEPELMRYYNNHMYDPFWTDPFSPDKPPSYPQMMVANCGCSCCLGPCCNESRQSDWKRLFLTFTVWAVIVEFLMLIIEVAIGGLSWPSLGPDGGTLADLGGKELSSIYCKYQVFRYITPVLLHAGVFHYLFNTLFAYRIMLPREVYWGMSRMIVMYVVSGIGGSIISLVLYPATGSVGASGALCGIFGGYVVDVARMWKKMSNTMRYQYGMNIVMYLVVMVMIGFFMENIDNGAHLGGFLTGIFFGMIILQKNLVARVIGGILLAILWVVPTVVLYTVLVRALMPNGCPIYVTQM